MKHLRKNVFLIEERRNEFMDKYKITFEAWNKVAQLYQEKFMDLKLYDVTYDIFCELILERHPEILEIGCGPGNITRYMLSVRPDFNILGIDVAPNMVDLARRNNPVAQFEVMDVRNMDKLKTKFDGIVCGFCLPYLSKEDCQKLIEDCKNLLTDEGIVYLSFVEGNYNNSGYQFGSSGDKTYFYYHELENLSANLNENGFEIMNLQHKHYDKKDEVETHTILIARKQV